MPQNNESTILYWLRDDLRLHDNECLHRACTEYARVLPVFCFDPRQFTMLSLGFRKTDTKRFYFLLDCLRDLVNSYRNAGGDVLFRVGHPEEVLPTLLEEYGCSHLIYQAEVAAEELAVERAVEGAVQEQGGEILRVWGKTLFHRDDLPFSAAEIPLTSKSFRIRAQKEAGVREALPLPLRINVPAAVEWGSFPAATEVGFRPEEDLAFVPALGGGETAALARLQYYTFGTDLIQRYAWTRNLSLGLDYSSKFSAWMARGCLSPRTIYHTVKRYETEVKRNKSTWKMVFEVVWRDYFIFSHMRHGNKVFFAGGIKDRETNWKTDEALFSRWCRGETGIPFVDAHMRELLRTGFMSNRGRVNCASFLTRDYEIDWRWGAAWFESHLLDYDVSSNWLNWNTQATEIYYTNPVHQSLKYDKSGEYLLSQLPELRDLPPPFFHAPWLAKEFPEIERPAYPEPAFLQKKWGRSIGNIRKLIPPEVLSTALTEDGGQAD